MLYMAFVIEVKNASPAKKLKIAVENTQNNAFVTLIFFEKNIASLLLKSIIIDVKK